MKKKYNLGNIVLIGPPGSGKSTIGRTLATTRSLSFWDTDDLLESDQNRSIQDIIKNDEEQAFKCLEEKVISNLSLTESIISTGGSVGLNKRLIDHLKSKKDIAIFMDTPPKVVLARIGNSPDRVDRVLGTKDLDLEMIVRKRAPIYRKNADLVFEIGSIEEAIDATTDRLNTIIEKYLLSHE